MTMKHALKPARMLESPEYLGNIVRKLCDRHREISQLLKQNHSCGKCCPAKKLPASNKDYGSKQYVSSQ